MAANEMRLDPVGLRGSGPEVARLAVAADGAATRLGGALDAEGTCWGHDEMGSAFGASYAPAATEVREALATLRDGLDGIGRSLSEVAARAEAAEVRTGDRFTEGA
jgi:hypothetical protein